MNFGFNSNVRARDAVYHVQTEDRGPSHPFLDTVVYESGRVVYKRSTSYEDFAAVSSKDIDFGEQLHERLARQHREVIGQLEAGTLALHERPKSQTDTPAAASSVTAPLKSPLAQNDGLDVRLLNPNTWLASGSATPHVTLEIELRRRNSDEIVADAAIEALLEHERKRVHCLTAQTDGAGRVTLNFPLPATAMDGSSLVIRATDGSGYGELRFRLKAKHASSAPGPISK